MVNHARAPSDTFELVIEGTRYGTHMFS